MSFEELAYALEPAGYSAIRYSIDYVMRSTDDHLLGDCHAAMVRNAEPQAHVALRFMERDISRLVNEAVRDPTSDFND